MNGVASIRIPNGRDSRLGTRKLVRARPRYEVNPQNTRAFLDRVDDRHVRVGHARKDRVLVVQPRVVDEVDEDLGVAGVPATGRDAQRASTVRASQLVAHERAVADILVGARTAALDDEVRLDAMERQAVVIVCSRQPDEPRVRERRKLAVEDDVEPAAVVQMNDRLHAFSELDESRVWAVVAEAAVGQRMAAQKTSCRLWRQRRRPSDRSPCGSARTAAVDPGRPWR